MWKKNGQRTVRIGTGGGLACQGFRYFIELKPQTNNSKEQDRIENLGM